MLKEEIKKLASQIHNMVIENRRHLHAYPELSFAENQTSTFIKNQLENMHIPWQPMADTGVVAIIKGEQPSENIVALRSDIDALPITEITELPYASKHNGVMHACGHDAHTASLLGTAFILQSIKNKLAGTIKLIFQPGEEKLPGGASIMIREGVLKNPEPQVIIGQHVMPSVPAGKIAVRKGMFMASMDELTIIVRGKGGHGAMPQQNIDAVLISSHIIIALQQIISRFNDPKLPGVLSIGRVIADGAINVMPDEVFMQGTFRTFDETWRAEAHRRMKNMSEQIAASMGGSCEFKIERGYPVLMNDKNLTGQVSHIAEEYLGKENVVESDMLTVAEDFAYYSQAMRGCFYLLGVGNEKKGTTYSLHNPRFNIDEDALAVSTGLMAYVAVRCLNND